MLYSFILGFAMFGCCLIFGFGASFSCSVDLKSLVEQNKSNYIPPTSRMTNYVVLKFGKLKPEPNVS